MTEITTKKQNICFVANFHKTAVFEAIANCLMDKGFSIFWIIPKASQYTYLRKSFPSENLLLLDRTYIKTKGQPINDFKINELVFGDRVWKYEKTNAVKYLTNIQQPIYDFIKQNAISCIFGEITWAHEVLIHRMCSKLKELNCRYYTDAAVRIPNGRFSFFKDEKQSILVEIECSTLVNKYAPLEVEKPTYLATNDKLLSYQMSGRGRLKRLKRFFTGENIEKTDPNTLHNRYRILLPIREIINQIRYRWIKRSDIKNVEGKKYIFFGFHKQPESSIDVMGRYFEDQFQNVVNLWRQLPPDWYLVIKEHSNAIGDRSYNFFKRLIRYPNVILINERTNSHLLIRNAQLVATVTGTIALEAALMDIPSITLSPTFFNKLNYCRHYTWTDLEKYSSIVELIANIKAQPNNIKEYTKYIMDNSYEGELTDILTSPDVMDLQNIEKLANAFRTIALKPLQM